MVFLRYGVRQMDGQKKWHIEVGASPKNHNHNDLREFHFLGKWDFNMEFLRCYFLAEVIFHPLFISSHSFLHHFEIINISIIYKLLIIVKEVLLIQKLLSTCEACPVKNCIQSQQQKHWYLSNLWSTTNNKGS